MAFLNSFRLVTVVFIAIALYFASNDPAVELARQRESIRRNPSAYVPPASQCTKTGRIALTFNNGVSLTNTPLVLDVLKAANTTATFYISPEWVGRLPLVDALLRRIHAEGHILGFHWYGGDPREMNDSLLRNKLIEQSTTVYNAAGVHPRFMRFPYEQLNQRVAAVANDLDLVLSSWNIDAADYQMCDDFPKRQYPYNAANVTNAYQKQFDLFRDAGNLQSSFIGLHTDLCPTAPAIGQLVVLGHLYDYEFVDIAACLGEVKKYRKSSSNADPTMVYTSSTKTSSATTTSTYSTPGTSPTNSLNSGPNTPENTAVHTVFPFNGLNMFLMGMTILGILIW